MTTVIYHSADYDGIFCREIARKFIPKSNLIGWNFCDKRIPIPTEGMVYILDLPPDCLEGGELGNGRVIWIDHHKTSIDKYGVSLFGYRIDGVAACRLAWQWFNRQMEGNPSEPDNSYHAKVHKHDVTCEITEVETGDGLINGCLYLPLPFKQDFIERKVSEPLAVRLAGEYDVWDKRDPDADIFQYGLRCQDGDLDWNELLSMHGGPYVDSLLKGGKWAQAYAQKMDSDLVKYHSYRLKWERLDFLVLNTGRFNSLTFAALDIPGTGHDALMGYMFNGKVWTVSLYHAKHRTDLDLSEIAKKYGGGGHRGACGFTCKTLPWMAHEACEKRDVA